MSFARKAADVAHKATASTLFGLFGFGIYTITGQVMTGRSDGTEEHPQAGFINMLRTKAEEEYKKFYDIDHRDWYDKDDNSYLKQM